eukprot:405403-Prymnesium_polylepis.1
MRAARPAKSNDEDAGQRCHVRARDGQIATSVVMCTAHRHRRLALSAAGQFRHLRARARAARRTRLRLEPKTDLVRGFARRE